ncbi:CDP-glycerol glycerophosphotransferase family protein [Olivibacter domesticus]|uniref:CDP-Glycerol:Poly(Glycerophosphate) glycerophosphotransferase n=1 Tax=Olivibacter domesticus TaxID=407022 RepID=A0A1H7V004_OLID1|nr:CDP-glycerol glycerophosphotransferase family protein [Olivibacter domesticus]SEM02225.1 CDP-Glycerol:Poly(glycerophosphate) glycerophosphotransferase [Olivibacter domesticus]
MRNLKALYKKIIPLAVRDQVYAFRLFLGGNKELKLIKSQQEQNRLLEEKIAGKAKIKVAFFVVFSAVWKFDELYKLLVASERFEPVIFICPYLIYGQEKMLEEMNIASKKLQEKGYHVVNTYNAKNDSWLDIKQEFKPDIVFFTNPYRYVTKDDYYITNFSDVLTCYVPYSCAVCSLQKSQYDQLFHNLLWRFFVETPINLEFSKTFSRIKGINTRVSGYPSLDVFLNKNYQPTDVWKIKDAQVKRVIWAPHHTIDNREELDFSTFLFYHEFMLKIATELEGKIQLAFKPHPILKAKLYDLEGWGKERTDNYYTMWEELPNGQLELGEYTDLFYTSDFMVFDSISFIMEYLYLQKPGIFTLKSPHVPKKLNKLGELCLGNYYKVNNKEELRASILQLLAGEDPLFQTRKTFFKEYLNPPNNGTATENIFHELIKTVK